MSESEVRREKFKYWSTLALPPRLLWAYLQLSWFSLKVACLSGLFDEAQDLANAVLRSFMSVIRRLCSSISSDSRKKLLNAHLDSTERWSQNTESLTKVDSVSGESSRHPEFGFFENYLISWWKLFISRAAPRRGLCSWSWSTVAQISKYLRCLAGRGRNR